LAEAIRRHADTIDPPILNQRRRDRLKIPHPQVWTVYRWLRDTDTSTRLSLNSIRGRATYRDTVNLSACGDEDKNCTTIVGAGIGSGNGQLQTLPGKIPGTALLNPKEN
jgi:hypothetical protein